MKLSRKLLFPFVPLYYAATCLRNSLYDFGLKTSKSYNFPVICVGNLSVGGTGKTPMIEYLIRFLKEDYKVATLSRGYKRKSKGFQLADAHTTVDSIGDEPFQFYTKFQDRIKVAVDANRQEGIEALRALENPPEIILLDDAFQHRKVKAGFNIVLTMYHDLYTDDMLLPAGNLRESIRGSKRAHVIIVTKCPSNLTDLNKKTIIKKLKPQPHQQVFFSSIAYADEVIALNGKKRIDALPPVTLVTGIANPKPLEDFLIKKKLTFEHLNFKDHHTFSKQDIENLNTKPIIVTTEKDFMRLKHYKALEDSLYYLPIAMHIDDSNKFHTTIKNFISKY
ncbi:tetraacyldisaccharide 4'-kinase [Mariniflexile ostreae]|uniref:Tetraacyldisaccharide 4'-kinase n=1 Tax=Mariniflexile ostreae TaxID=1520892 RepID=A0ABV5F8I9_9FLAO